MDTAELRHALTSHTSVLAANGADLDSPSIDDPADPAEIDAVEQQLGFPIPTTTRATFESVTRAVRWAWWAPASRTWGGPFSEISHGELQWSLDSLVEQHQYYESWRKDCFANPDDPYEGIWHHKLGLAAVGNGDVIAVDLDPKRSGAIIYLSHDLGDGHGYLMAHSLNDLLERTVPLACPGPEDWQWLPFVPYDLGPIDPAGEAGTSWRRLLGLTAAPPRTVASVADNALFDHLMDRYRAAGSAHQARHLALRALKVCDHGRADAVVGLLDAADMHVQEEAARTLGRWQWQPAVPQLLHVAQAGQNNGRIAALLALRSMPGPEAERALSTLRSGADARRLPNL